MRKTQTPEVAHVSESAEKMSLSEGDGGHNPLPSPGYLRVKKQWQGKEEMQWASPSFLTYITTLAMR